MPSNYPGSLDALTNPSAGDSQATVSHSAQHANANDAIEAVQAELGVNPSGDSATVTARLDTLAVGAAGSSLRQLPVQMTAGERLLREAVWWIDAAHSSASGQSVSNLGWGGSALDATVGSGTGADSNDPKFLDWSGSNYVYLPGVASNYLSVPDADSLDVTGDLTLVCYAQLDSWTTDQFLIAKYAATTSYAMRVRPDGTIWFQFSSDGTTIRNIVSTASTGLAAGAAKWVAITMDVDNGASGYSVRFWLSDDGASWSQLGSTVTNSGATSIAATSEALNVGAYYNGAASVVAGRIYRAIVRSGIGAAGVPGGTTVCDVDTSLATSGSATTFTARTGQTVTVNRSTSGRKACVVTHPVWLFGTDDYMSVADNDLIDFGASDSFTAVAIWRPWATVANDTILFKSNDESSTMSGYVIYTNGSGQLSNRFGDGTNRQAPGDGTALTMGSLQVMGLLRNAVADTRSSFLNGTIVGTDTDTTTGTLANALPLRVGRMANAALYADMEFIAAAVFRRALTATEITTLTNYYAGRVA